MDLEQRVTELRSRVERLEERGNAKTLEIQSFAPEPYVVLSPLRVAVSPAGDAFEASFYDANIHTAGETEQEAFENLKSLILDVFDSLEGEPEERLGPEPARQRAVLRSFLRGA